MPPLQKELPICVLPCGFHTTIKPCSTKLCVMEGCELADNNTNILTCGHAYHVPCLKKLDDICIYCLDYYTKEIDKLSSSFNNQLLNDIETEDNDDLGIDENDEEEGEDGDEERININNKENVNVENELTQAIDSFIRSFNVDLLSNNVITSSIQKDNSAKNKRRRVGISKGNIDYLSMNYFTCIICIIYLFSSQFYHIREIFWYINIFIINKEFKTYVL